MAKHKRDKMASFLRSISSRLVTTQSSSTNGQPGDFRTVKEDELFPKPDPAVDGEECLHDCHTCTIKYPRKFAVDTDDKLYGHVGGWSTHLIVATGKTDWVRDVADEEGSVMQAVDHCGVRPKNGKMMLSASNMPLPDTAHHDPEGQVRTRVLLLPAFKYIDHVSPAAVPALIQSCVDTAPTNTTPLDHDPSTDPETREQEEDAPPLSGADPSPVSLPSGLEMKDCPHDYLILLCSQATRDARCGQSAPLLRKELERHLRPLGLYRDLDDERPGGVGIYFISHVGGHKYSANVMIYRRAGAGAAAAAGASKSTTENGAHANGNGNAVPVTREAAQCIWLARIRPEHCENLVRYTVLQGKVLDPANQLRGGFDRSQRLTSW